MIHCPNCGSSTQFKLSTPLYIENGVWKQQKKCGCGCVVIFKAEPKIEEIIYPEN